MRCFRFASTVVTVLLASGLVLAGTPAAAVDAPPLATVSAVAAGSEAILAFDGVVEAVREAVVAAQVPGAIVALGVEAGDRVEKDRILLRIDARLADRQAAANEALLQSARADLAAATRDVERQRRLHRESYISRAALDSAESGFVAARSRVDALVAQTRAAHIQSGLHEVKAPFAGVVSDVPVSDGDMAMPGRPLFALYDPAALRVAVVVPQTVAARLGDALALRIEVPGMPSAPVSVAPADVQLLPVVDAASHTARLRIALPAQHAAVVPGMFVRLRITLASGADPAAAASVTVPAVAVVRRAELTGLYVLDGSGRAMLRQVRLGRPLGDRVEILAGLAAGEQVVVDPLAAARRSRPSP